ncbi:mycothione reductase [Nocardioides marinquilinus]|uniref:Mycothione reductase n=1 Tax=Nocardioides marinquilinus TaxID=1210400 RepID=A0ABP9Q226_9ACTN
MTHYDLIVIGTGSGNTIVDERFASWRVAIVERGLYGGTCLNRGCIPSKMLVLPADAAQRAARAGHLDVHSSFDGVDWPALRDRVFGRTDHVAGQGHDYRHGQDGVDALDGTARFVGPRTLRVAPTDGGEEVEISADHVVIATGSRPVLPDVPGLAEAEPYTSDDVMRIDALPRRLGIVGGGYVGCELAHVFASFGVEVVQVESADSLLDNQDEDVARVFTDLASQRWDVRLEARLTKVVRDEGPDGEIHLHLEGSDPVTVDALLVAAGRRPNSDLLDLDGTGIEVDDQGLVVVDEHQRTTAEGVWALGDASSRQPLKHVANQDARVVQHNLLHPHDLMTSDHRFVPAAVFSSPQVGTVGLTEEQAREQGLDLAVVRHQYASTAYGWALNDDDAGFLCKLLADRSTGLLVGAHLVGPQAASLVQPLIQAMSFGQPVKGLARGQYWIHPAPTEVVENALIALEGEL